MSLNFIPKQRGENRCCLSPPTLAIPFLSFSVSVTLLYPRHPVFAHSFMHNTHAYPPCSVFGAGGCLSRVCVLRFLTVSVGKAALQVEDYKWTLGLSRGEHSIFPSWGRAWWTWWGKGLIREKPL